MSISKNTLLFLEELNQNNNREWFRDNNQKYEAAKANMEAVVEELILKLGVLENMANVLVKNCTYRINRDIRFSSDKSPYKHWFSASFSQGGRKSPYLDYYLHIQPNGESFLAGGLYAPTSEHLGKMRQEIDYSAPELKKIITNKCFLECFGELQGNELKTAPKGYEKTHPEIALIRKTQWYVIRKISDDDICSDDFVANYLASCQIMKPLLDWFNSNILDLP